MKTYDQLTEEQQAKAHEKALIELLTDIVQNGLRFNDKLNHDNLQARIDDAGRKAEAMQTPWFWHEYIMETCKEDLEDMASAIAQEALYPEPDEHVIRGVL